VEGGYHCLLLTFSQDDLWLGASIEDGLLVCKKSEQSLAGKSSKIVRKAQQPKKMEQECGGRRSIDKYEVCRSFLFIGSN
jgi:hypothetical protein